MEGWGLMTEDEMLIRLSKVQGRLMNLIAKIEGLKIQWNGNEVPGADDFKDGYEYEAH